MKFFKQNLWKIIITLVLCAPLYIFYDTVFAYATIYCVPLSMGSLRMPGSFPLENIPPPCGIITTLLESQPFQTVILGLLALITIVSAYFLAFLAVKLYTSYVHQRAKLEQEEAQKRLNV